MCRNLKNDGAGVVWVAPGLCKLWKRTWTVMSGDVVSLAGGVRCDVIAALYERWGRTQRWGIIGRVAGVMHAKHASEICDISKEKCAISKAEYDAAVEAWFADAQVGSRAVCLCFLAVCVARVFARVRC